MLTRTPGKRHEGSLHRCELVVVLQVEVLYIRKHCRWIPCQGLRDIRSDFLGHTEGPHITELAEKVQEWCGVHIIMFIRKRRGRIDVKLVYSGKGAGRLELLADLSQRRHLPTEPPARNPQAQAMRRCQVRKCDGNVGLRIAYCCFIWKVLRFCAINE